MAEMMPFGADADIATNPEPRCACVLLLDVSKSMAGERIASLNEGLKTYREALLSDPLAAQRVETALVTFGGEVQTVVPFAIAERFIPPTLTVSGNTPMGAALRHGIELVKERKQVYRTHGLQYFRPWIFMMTDGGPTDEWQSAAELVKQGETAKAFSFFAVGIGEAKMDILSKIGTRGPLPLSGVKFREMFVWLSSSLGTLSHSKPGEEDGIKLSDPSALEKWLKM
ncbi:MAG TPA: VWA domain-containing protein [Gemmata sp.]|jgi:uncharacterized protein YegL|nr:VWA domain-containing protein [Gemmata sp.]